QMAVHVPLSPEAQLECRLLLWAPYNILSPANGQPVAAPSQDIVIGCYYLTREKPGQKGAGMVFADMNEVRAAYDADAVALLARIKMRWAGEMIETTVGRVLFNEVLPAQLRFVNQEMNKRELTRLVSQCYYLMGNSETVTLLDALKDLGFRYATLAGISIGVDDLLIPANKEEIIGEANREVVKVEKEYQDGLITKGERYNKIIDVWTHVTERVSDEMFKEIERKDEGEFNPVFMMADSGARGSRQQIRQLAGMRGLMAKPSGDIIELPIRSNFKEGLSVIEFFISTNGARKGLADTALKTADAGYLTRRLVDISQDVVVNEVDCGTINGIVQRAIKDGEEIVTYLKERIVGRFTLERIKHPITGEVIVDVNEEITEDIAAAIEDAGIEEVIIRTVLTCEARHGVCRMCYGRNLATGRAVEIGEAVGIIAAQSIGQPGTQLTMRTFHIGGAATKASEENRVYMKYPVLITDIQGSYVQIGGRYLFTRKGFLQVCKVFASHDLGKGDKVLVEDGTRILKGQEILKRKGGELVWSHDIAYARVLPESLLLIAQESRIEVRNGSEVVVRKGEVVPAQATISTFDPFSDPIISEYDGYVRYEDIIPGSTLKEEINEETGNVEKKIAEFSAERDAKQPRIVITDEAGNETFTYFLPGGAYINVEDGELIRAGRTLARTLKESAKAMDITGGLPRVSELFEARKPKTPAVLATVSGTVVFQGIAKGKRILVVRDLFNKEFKHLVPMGRRLLVRDGDQVEAGDKLCDGNQNPHDIMIIRGEHACQRFLMDEVQQVYRLQGVTINDKHIGIIVRQMMKKVEIVQPGDTRFIYGQQVDKYKFHEENRRVLDEGGQPAVGRPLLLGITRASLKIDSFFAAASFQETTRVLTDAAIAGATDGLRGLKENVIIGHLIPAGTGMRKYRNIRLSDGEHDDLDAYVEEVLEKRRKEKELQPLMALEDRADLNDASFEEDTAFGDDEGFSPVDEEV
ncbi:MAG TPA: DNA-directed RNA polymerase subunit beta', partial [Magnetospirillaceae bacterium]|nr:DNA-directed RNA polymerase subunit beta' [Magnetospirillaceae bacterium]